MGARRYLFAKVASALGTLLFVLTFNFFLFRVAGDPVKLLVRSQKLSPAQQAELYEALGLDHSLPVQYVQYLGQTLRGDLGISFMSGQPVSQVIAQRIWPTLLLVGTGTILATIFGILLGIAGAYRRGTLFDGATMMGAMTFYSMPDFWLGMLLLMLFGVALGWFPVAGYETYGADYSGVTHWADVFHHVFLPCLTITVGYIADYSLIMRSTLLEVLNEDFITTARAKGLSDRTVRRRHAIPNALLPIATALILYFSYVLGGSITVEIVFSYPGLGLLTWQAIENLDFPVLQGIFLLSSVAIIAAGLIADISYSYLDPRVREA